MKKHPCQLRRKFVLLALCCGLTSGAHAQVFPGGGQGTTTRRSGTTGTSTREYPNNTDIGDAMISVDPETRKLVVVADETTMAHISQVISNLDRPKPQVLIKVVFLEVTHTKGLDFGIEGSYTKNIGNSYLSGLMTNFAVVGSNILPTSIVPAQMSSILGASNIFGLGAAGGSPIPPGAGIYSILGQDYQVTLRAIAQADKLEVLSRPSILARNNQQATISLGQQIPLITNTRFDTTGNQINTVSYQSVGIILRVTPFITPEGMVEMIIAPESSGLADRSNWVPISSGTGGIITAPVINSRSADTVVVVPDGQTVIIGGLMENTKSESESKIPLLGDIPLLGNLFKHKIRNSAKTELIIFLTPRIVQDPSQLAALSATEKDNSQLMPKAFTEGELNQFLDGIEKKSNANSKSGKTSESPRNRR